MKRILICVFTLVLTAAFVVGFAAAAEQEMPAIAEQIRTFAASIDKTDADDSAAVALASHGLTGRGRKLSVGVNHALTATLLNSEVIQQSLAAVCEQSVEYMQSLGEKALYLDLHSGWATFGYYYEIYRMPAKNTEEMIFKSGVVKGLSGNGYDQSLVWMAGSIAADMEITESAVSSDAITYDVKIRFWDRFDFSTSSGDGFKDLISGLGAILFREFDWEASAAYQIVVPNTCTHSAANYHWVLDPETGTMESKAMEGYAENKAQKFEHELSNGNKRSYYGLDRTVILSHDKPWKMELTVTNPRNILFNATAKSYDCYPSLMLHSRNFFCARQYEQLDVSETFILANTHCYGTALRPNFSFVDGNPYRLCLENRVFDDGSNMIYLTVYNYLGGVSLPTAALDTYYFTDTLGTVHELRETNHNGLSGMDFRISYIGSGANDYYGYSHGFSAQTFDLKVWEGGREGSADCFTSDVTAPTCSARGYTTHTCSLCGYSYKDSYTGKTAHEFGDWKEAAAPTCVSGGIQSRECSSCGGAETREAEALGHRFGSWIVSLDPGCTTGGEEYRVCSVCGLEESQPIEARGHCYTSVTVMPACTEPGYTTHTCACGDSYTDATTESIGHDLRNGTCDLCGDVIIAAPMVKGSNKASTGMIALNWEAVEGAVKYEVYRATSKLGTYSLMKTTTGCTYTNTTAKAGQYYYYYVRAIDADSNYADSGIVGRTCDLAQTKVTVSNVASSGKVRISWEPVEGATGYQVYRATSRDGTYSRISTTGNTSVANTKAEAGKTYYYKVRAICDVDAAAAAFSGVKSRTCDLPQPKVSVALSSRKPKVSWKKVDGAVAYKIYRATSKNGAYSLVKTTTSLKWKDTSAKSGKTCYYKVVAVCSNTAGNSAYSSVVSIKSK